jgi:hypothetical protein
MCSAYNTQLRDDAQLLHIFREVSIGRGLHGGFLLSFAEAVTRADPENFVLLRPVMVVLVEKYSLDKYLDTYEAFA